LHWSDVSTLDWLTCVARRQELARLLVLGTYRPVDVMVREHPLKTVKQELQLHGHCQELALDFLREGDVTEYLTVRFSVGTTHAAPLRSLARIIHRRTDGNPLFMVNLIEHLLSRGVLVQTDRQWVLKNEDLAGTVPEDLRQLIEQQIMRISPDERKILEVASVAGAEFSAAAVAAGTGQSTEVVETHCDTLVRREQFLRTQGTGEWPDGTVAARYGFVHALYQEVLYEQLSATRRMRLHRQIGEREEQGYSDRASERAAELAMHFERGRETKRAIQYLQHAGKNAVRRSAHQEAVTLLTKGLELLKTLPDTPERTRQELTLQIALGAPLQAIKGFAASEVKNAYARARELCQQIGETPQLFPILHGLWTFYLMRTEFQTAQELGNQLLTLAQKIQDPALLLQAHSMLGLTLWPLGEIVSARAHLEQSLAFYDPQKSRSSVGMTLMSIVASVTSSMEALALWLLGYPDQALQRDHEALTLVQDLARPHGLAMALTSSGWLHQFRREGQAAQARAEAAIALSIEQGFAHLLAVGTSQRGWALTQQGQEEEGIMQLRQGLAASRATGQELYLSCPLALLAEAYGNTGQPKEGLAVLAEALAMVNKTGERYYEAELYRIKGELTLQNGARDWGLGAGSPSPQAPSLKPQTPKEVVREAEEYFLKAITIAQKQQAKSLELRAVISLSRLWQQQGRQKQARKLLAEIYGWFTEGFDTKDLQEAKALLEVSH